MEYPVTHRRNGYNAFALRKVHTSVMDLTELSRNRAFADAILLGGDEDLRIGIELAQEYGTRVHLLTIEGASSSPTLRQESDTITVLARTDIQTFITVRVVAPPAAVPATPATPASQATQPVGPVNTAANSILASSTNTTPTTPSADFDVTVQGEITAYLAALSPTEQASLTAALKTGAGVPAEHDGRLLARTWKALGRPLV
jgi:hypothetical protein